MNIDFSNLLFLGLNQEEKHNKFWGVYDRRPTETKRNYDVLVVYAGIGKPINDTPKTFSFNTLHSTIESKKKKSGYTEIHERDPEKLDEIFYEGFSEELHQTIIMGMLK